MINKTILEHFDKLWSNLFLTSVHLDSALSKEPPTFKSILANIVTPILLHPVSLAEQLGIGIPPGEPWSLSLNELSQWKCANQMASRLLERKFPVQVTPLLEDFPPGMVTEWKNSWGNERVENLIQILAQSPPLSLRVSRKRSPSALLKEFSASNPRGKISGVSPVGIYFPEYTAVLSSQSFLDGGFEIQDEGSQVLSFFSLWPELFGNLLSIKPGPMNLDNIKVPTLPQAEAWTVIDACAGAGGKTLALADALEGRGRVYAYDRSEKKLQALRRRGKRAQIHNVQAVAVQEGEEGKLVKQFRKRAHAVLVDAPCSGWGVLRRNPDIKWRQPKKSVDELPEVQLQLLKAYSDLVMPGGRLIYGVCTFRARETLEVVERFLNDHSEFQSEMGGYLGPGPCDGFFMQSFKRNKGRS